MSLSAEGANFQQSLRPPHPSCLCPSLSPPSELVQGVAMSTSAATPFRSIVQTTIFSVSPSSLVSSKYSTKHHHHGISLIIISLEKPTFSQPTFSLITPSQDLTMLVRDPGHKSPQAGATGRCEVALPLERHPGGARGEKSLPIRSSNRQ